jgi:hypothetical protein
MNILDCFVFCRISRILRSFMFGYLTTVEKYICGAARRGAVLGWINNLQYKGRDVCAMGRHLREGGTRHVKALG